MSNDATDCPTGTAAASVEKASTDTTAGNENNTSLGGSNSSGSSSTQCTTGTSSNSTSSNSNGNINGNINGNSNGNSKSSPPTSSSNERTAGLQKTLSPSPLFFLDKDKFDKDGKAEIMALFECIEWDGGWSVCVGFGRKGGYLKNINQQLHGQMGKLN